MRNSWKRGASVLLTAFSIFVATVETILFAITNFFKLQTATDLACEFFAINGFGNCGIVEFFINGIIAVDLIGIIATIIHSIAHPRTINALCVVTCKLIGLAHSAVMFIVVLRTILLAVTSLQKILNCHKNLMRSSNSILSGLRDRVFIRTKGKTGIAALEAILTKSREAWSKNQ